MKSNFNVGTFERAARPTRDDLEFRIADFGTEDSGSDSIQDQRLGQSPVAETSDR